MAKRGQIPPFSRIAYNNLGNDKAIVDRLNREMEKWLRSKKSVSDLIGRIRDVTGMSYWQAKRVAQTERTRVQNQARHEAIRDENRRRVGMKRYRKQWVHRPVADKPRDDHVAMSGTVVHANEYFHLPSGARLMYPGDPTAPAGEIINCHCYIRKVAPE